ncbi:SAM-dependent methyltransferase [Lysobacter sp. GX 14042]|uniref:N-6 DNA methylase n=1 Tax=Lysobacter sp. GX 14042 TaxID=2907155 RepID=UPI001F27235D|nr:N-6 DNA methylase [Lysobacter sp. GX 14042]MCE7032867.1 SAM-dependent methyltransferase [Lysobacter sp. GX 14042]
MPPNSVNRTRVRNISLGQFFSKVEVGTALASFIDGGDNISMVDLGAGDGSLSRSVSSAWPLSKMVTIDVDERLVPEQFAPLHFHIAGDALNVHLPQQLEQKYGTFDLAICNPPYVKRAWRSEFAHILAEAGLAEVCPVFPEARLEIVFLAQLLRIVRTGGQLALIIPDGPISGERHRQLRQHLLLNHKVERVISLPSGMFVGTEARAHILILRKGRGPSEMVSIAELRSGEGLSSPIAVDLEAATDRLDYAFHATKANVVGAGSMMLRELGGTLVRGAIRSSSLRSHAATFHTSDFPRSMGVAKVRLPSCTALEGVYPVAAPKDILVARVGRCLEDKVCVVSAGYAYLSDCVFRLRVPDELAARVLENLTSSRGRAYLRAVSRGVGARYLTADALLDFRVEGAG